MKKGLYPLAALAVLAVWSAFAGEPITPEWGAMTNNVRMSITLESGQGEVKTNEPVGLLIRIKNTSTIEDFLIVHRNRIEYDELFSFSVISPSGKVITPIHTGVGGSGTIGRLAPSETIVFKFNLSSRYKFEMAGTYRVVATREICARRRNNASAVAIVPFEVVSNPMDVHVVLGKRARAQKEGPERGQTEMALS
jgi:hypothetical protein